MKTNQAVAIESVKAAINNLTNISVGFDDLGDATIPLQDSVVMFTESVDKYLSMFALKDKSTPTLEKGPELTRDILIERLNKSIDTINEADQYGLAEIAPKAMMQIRKTADGVYSASVNLIVASIRYKATNK